MDLIEKEHVTLFKTHKEREELVEIGEVPREHLLKARARSLRKEPSERGFSKPRRATQEHVAEGLTPRFSSPE